MAAVALPLIELLGPEILNLIVALVHRKAPVAEQQLGPGTNVAKFGQVFGDVITALNAAATAGKIPKQLPPDPVIQMIIQAVVTSMKLSGLLTSAPVAIGATASQPIILSAGQSVTIQVL